MAKIETMQVVGNGDTKKTTEPLSSITDPAVELEDLSVSDGSGPTPSSSSVNSREDSPPPKVIEQQPRLQKPESLQDRSRIPESFYVSLLVIGMLEYGSGMYKVDTLTSWWSSFSGSFMKVYDLLEYEKDLMQSVVSGDFRDPMEYLKATIVTIVIGSIMWVLIGKPLSAGLWTGQKATKHKLHRYMGLFFLIQYTLAWVEFIMDEKFSFLVHTVALNGVVQGYSAYFSFKVLPELKDSGFYSNKGVMSRNFLHENVCFNVFCVFGAVFYNDELRAKLRSNLVGNIIVYAMVFFPFVSIRCWFPTTRFSDAGSRQGARTADHQRFYEIGVRLVKIFYLWSKYFLGFHLNFLIFLDLVSAKDMRFIQGIHLLNTGTVAIAMFLHTLRFKKVLPAKFTFSFYLVQIYLTFTALPWFFETFLAHRKLSALTFVGIFCNMTRKNSVHAAWCVGAMLMMTCTDINW